ncbi:hypothetical protein EDD28_0095 [Salana multivorans]|uniref:Uncharacterized protein n=1 Tax=Salana multivorans TaxID=120377 RepID=A0A3N2D6Y4_9MICO|nr:hypothetical protein EDD28_0095 [Salana multivorans]
MTRPRSDGIIDLVAIARALDFDWPVIERLTRREFAVFIDRLAQMGDPLSERGDQNWGLPPGASQWRGSRGMSLDGWDGSWEGASPAANPALQALTDYERRRIESASGGGGVEVAGAGGQQVSLSGSRPGLGWSDDVRRRERWLVGSRSQRESVTGALRRRARRTSGARAA